MNAQFLPSDYISPKSNSGYTKLENGTTKIRILSMPVIGWEEWIDNKPVRYKMEDKPDFWRDSLRPGKHFWAMLVWNYQANQIQIFHITQGSIRKAIESLSKDPDWMAPYFYDIKITREGEGLKTKYTVNPLPHKPVSDEIQKAFENCPCNLDALFTGEDPFGFSDTFTNGIFFKDKIVSFNQKDEASEKKPNSDHEVDAFIDSMSLVYDENLLREYIQVRSDHFKVSLTETISEMMKDQKKFEREFMKWSDKKK